MFKHEKQLFHPVAVERPNPQYAALLQEQLGGGNGELAVFDQGVASVRRRLCRGVGLGPAGAGGHQWQGAQRCGCHGEEEELLHLHMYPFYAGQVYRSGTRPRSDERCAMRR